MINRFVRPTLFGIKHIGTTLSADNDNDISGQQKKDSRIFEDEQKGSCCCCCCCCI